MAQDREISCPSAGRYVSAYREIGMSASTIMNNPPSTVSCAHRRCCTRYPQVWAVFCLTARYKHPSYVHK